MRELKILINFSLERLIVIIELFEFVGGILDEL